MGLAFVLLLGCEQDLLLLGNITGLGSLPPPPASLAAAVAAPEPLPIVAAELDPLPNGGLVEQGEPVAAGEAPPAAPVEFNPISIPEGPREGDGVRWEGVKAKGRSLAPISSRMSKGPDRDFQK